MIIWHFHSWEVFETWDQEPKSTLASGKWEVIAKDDEDRLVLKGRSITLCPFDGSFQPR